MSLSKQLSNSLEGIPSIHLDPGDPGSPDPDCSNPKKQPAAAPLKLGFGQPNQDGDRYNLG